MIIAVDFDDTIATGGFPYPTEEVPYACFALKQLKRAGHKLMLFTCRSEKIYKDEKWNPDSVNVLSVAIDWLHERGVDFDYINDNPECRTWTSSNKPYYDILIDDRNVGTPLIDFMGTLVVDWKRVLSLISHIE